MNSQSNSEFGKSVLEQVKQIILGNLSGAAAKVYLFGSWAREEMKRSSDIDVAIEFERFDAEVKPLLLNIRDALEESTIPYKVDVIHLNTADEIIASKVREEGILWADPLNELKQLKRRCWHFKK